MTNDRITTLEVDYDESEKSFTASGKDYVADDNAYNRILNYRMYSPYKTYGGNVYASGIKVNGVYDYSLANLRLLDIGGAKCVLFNRGTQQLRPLGVNEILDYVSAGENASEIMVIQNYWQVKMCIRDRYHKNYAGQLSAAYGPNTGLLASHTYACAGKL